MVTSTEQQAGQLGRATESRPPSRDFQRGAGVGDAASGDIPSGIGHEATSRCVTQVNTVVAIVAASGSVTDLFFVCMCLFIYFLYGGFCFRGRCTTRFGHAIGEEVGMLTVSVTTTSRRVKIA